MKSAIVSRHALLKSSQAIAAGLILSPGARW